MDERFCVLLILWLEWCRQNAPQGSPNPAWLKPNPLDFVKQPKTYVHLHNYRNYDFSEMNPECCLPEHTHVYVHQRVASHSFVNDPGYALVYPQLACGVRVCLGALHTFYPRDACDSLWRRKSRRGVRNTTEDPSEYPRSRKYLSTW